MVMWNTPNYGSRARRGLSLLLLVSALGLGCSSLDGPTADVDTWKADWKDRSARMADGAAAAGDAVGESVTTAYSGVREGFEEPDHTNFGPYPKRYVRSIKRHMLRFEGVPDDANFQFGKPQKGFMNKGILAGGKIDWQGYLIDLNVETTTFAGQKRTKSYIVRMKDGEVVEVHDAAYSAALRRLEGEANVPPPARRAR
jgi:hypothetical protein